MMLAAISLRELPITSASSLAAVAAVGHNSTEHGGSIQLTHSRSRTNNSESNASHMQPKKSNATKKLTTHIAGKDTKQGKDAKHGKEGKGAKQGKEGR